MSTRRGRQGLWRRLAFGGLGCALALGAAAAWAADAAPRGDALRTLREAGWACLERGDTEGALRAAAQMLQVQPGHRDALLLEERAHQARLAPAPRRDAPLSHPETCLLDEVRREAGAAAKPASPGRPARAGPLQARTLFLDQPVTIDLAETPLPEALRRLSDAAGLPITLADDAARTATPITLRSTGLPLDAVLRWIGRLSRLHYGVREGAVVFSARPTEAGAIVRQTYELQDLVAPPKGPARDPETLGAGLVRHIRATVAPGSWQETGGEEAVLQEGAANTVAYRGGRIVVVHNPEVQKQVADLLDMFRREHNLTVHIQCRFIILTRAELTSLGIDLSYDSLLGPTDHSRAVVGITHGTEVPGSRLFTNFDNKGGLSLTCRVLSRFSLSAVLTAVTKRMHGTVLTAPRITCFNGQRANLQVLTNHNYVRRVTGDNEPEIGNIPEGMIFDVQPFVSADRRYITLTLQPQQRELTSLIDYHFLTRTLLTEGVTTNVNVLIPYEVLIQIPTTRLRSVGTTVTVPNGGTLLVAGLTEIETNSGTATLPWVQGVPILRYVFRRTDELEGRRSLLILVTAETVPDILAE